MRTVHLAQPQSDQLTAQITGLRLALEAAVARDADHQAPELRACLALAQAVEATAERVLQDTVPA